MFTLNLYDRNGVELHEGDIVKVWNRRDSQFYAEVKYLEKECSIAPFHTFSFHSFEKVDAVPEGAKECNESRYKIWFMNGKDDDKSAEEFEKYLIDWLQCEHLLKNKCYRIEPEKKLSDYTTEELKEELNRRGGYFISWCEDDIQIVIDDQFEDDERLIDNPLNDDDIRIILEKIFDDHDANIGINWDVLYYGIDSYLDERKKSQNTQP